MKKIFLLFLIAAFSSAFAQQKNVFDIQTHIQKKASAAKERAERYLPKPKYHCFGMEVFKEYDWRPYYTMSIISNAQNGMSCIVPEIKMFVQIPGIGYDKDHLIDMLLSKYRQFGKKPYGTLPYYIVPR